MHDLLRAYANERRRVTDSVGERDAALRRLDCWYVHSTASAKAATDGFPLLVDVGPVEPGVTVVAFDGPKSARSWLDVEWATLVATVRQASDQGRHAAVYRLVLAMFTTMMARCSYLDGLELLELALESARTVGDRRSEGHLADRMGSMYIGLGRSADELVWFKYAADLLHEVRDPVGEAAAHREPALTRRSS